MSEPSETASPPAPQSGSSKGAIWAIVLLVLIAVQLIWLFRSSTPTGPQGGPGQPALTGGPNTAPVTGPGGPNPPGGPNAGGPVAGPGGPNPPGGPVTGPGKGPGGPGKGPGGPGKGPGGGPPGGPDAPTGPGSPGSLVNSPVDIAAAVLALDSSGAGLTAAQKTQLQGLMQDYYQRLTIDYAAADKVMAILNNKQKEAFYQPHEQPKVDPKAGITSDPYQAMALELLKKKAGRTPATPATTPAGAPAGPGTPDKGFMMMQIVYLESKPDLALDPAQARTTLDVITGFEESAKKDQELRQKVQALITPEQWQKLASMNIVRSPDVVALQLLLNSLKAK